MTGFLPLWLAAPGMLTAVTMILVVLAARCGIPLWLMPLAAVLAIGTLH